MKKGRKKRMVIIPVLILCVTVAGTAGYFKWTHVGTAQKESVKIQSAEAKKGTLSQTIVGTGNLELADGEDQKVPSGLTISEVKTESGDEVKTGDVLAVVDENSILDAMEQVQDEIAQLDESIQEYQDQDSNEENVITASVAGRVKKINVSSGSDLSDVMVEEGALLLLSLDGKMEVSLEKVSGVNTDDPVTVVLSSGAQVSGTVDSVSGDTCSVTVTDNGTVYGDKVTVLDENGNTLGSGTLMIHQPLSVTGTSGVVSAVNVAENDGVSEGTTLLTLEGNANDTEYQELLAKREARTATLKKLLELKADPEIKAEISGTVQSVNVSEGTAAAENTSTEESSSSSGTTTTKTVSKMSWTVPAARAGSTDMDMSQSYVNVGAYSTKIVKCSSVEEGVTDSSPEEAVDDEKTGEIGEEPEEKPVQDETAESAEMTALKFMISTEGTGSATSLVILAPITGEAPTTSVNAADGTYTGTVSWNPGDKNFQEKTVYQANVSLTAADGYLFRADSISGITLGTVSGVSVSEDGKNMTFQITFPETAALSEEIDADKDDNAGNKIGEKDADQFTDEKDESESTENSSEGNDSQKTSATEKSGNTGISSSNSTDTGAAGQTQSNNGTAQTSEPQTGEDSGTSKTEISQSEYSTDVTAFTIAPDDTMLLNVSVDELDINSVKTGQEAQITFDAIEDKEFTGKVTKIGNTASVNGGVAKYTVSLSVPKDDQMKQGMNASATITIESRENVITVPVSALQEKGNKTFVYTQKDENGNLSGETEVTTGLSDGSTVEITEGLSEGDTVYYNKGGNSESGNNGSSEMPGEMNDSRNKGSGGTEKDFENGGRSGGPGGNGNFSGNGGGTPPNM